MSKKKAKAIGEVGVTPPEGRPIPTTNSEGCDLVRLTIRDAELAKKLGVSRAAVGKWKEIPANRVTQVAEATGLKPEWIRPQPYA